MRPRSPYSPIHSRLGFSLLEVLIAVVILSFGLLALASMQLSLIRSSSESKAQTTAIALAKDKIEEIKAFSDQAAYVTWNSQAKPTVANVTDVNGSLGGVNFKRWWTIDRYVFNGATFSNVGASLVSGSDTALATANANYVPGNEFKRIAMRVAWNDASGVEQIVTLEDSIASIVPADSAFVFSPISTKTRGPQVLINNPGLEAGVIPIALGTNSATAATNPKPEVISQGNNSSVVETRFDVLTYSNINDTAVQAQQRVETAVLGCKCSLGTGVQTAYRPTYWDGVRYVPPTTYASVPVATAASGVTQSARCTTCCKDHFDPSAAPGAKYDERRGTHSHYLAADLATAVTSGSYNESCRLIRVDGFFRTATDTFNDYFGLLETDASSLTPYVPSPAAKTRYETFVIDYLKKRFITGFTAPTTPSETAAAKAAFNTVLTPSQVSVLEEPLPNPSLNTPTEVTINSVTAPKWLHSRGMYIDYLSDEAVDTITLARQYCAANVSLCTGTATDPNLRTRILSVLPFTSINVSEIANWTTTLKNNGADSTRVIKMDNSIGFVNSADPNQIEPVKGKVLLGSNYSSVAGNVDNTADAKTTIGPSNSGLALYPAIDPADVITSVVTDTQAFRINGVNPPPPVGGGAFTVSLSATPELLVAANSPFIGFTPSPSPTLTNCLPTGTGVNPYVCTTSAITIPAQVLGGASLITIGNYNRQVLTADSTVQVLNTCTSTPTTDRIGMPYREILDIQSVTSSNILAVVGALSVSNADVLGGYPTGEYTTVTVTPVNGPVQNSPNPGDALMVNFGNKKFFCPDNYNSGNFVAVTTGNNRTCTTGQNSIPIWSSTYVNCGTSLPTPP